MSVAHPRLLDLAGWTLVILASLVALAGIIGFIGVLHARSTSGQAAAQARLNDAAYVVLPEWTSALAFALCVGLAVAIGFLGYLQTRHFVEHRLLPAETGEHDTPGE